MNAIRENLEPWQIDADFVYFLHAGDATPQEAVAVNVVNVDPANDYFRVTWEYNGKAERETVGPVKVRHGLGVSADEEAIKRAFVNAYGFTLHDHARRDDN